MHRAIPLALLAAGPALAQTAPPPARAADLVTLLNGGGSVADIFTPAFIADVPEASLRTLAAQLTAHNGRALRIARSVSAGLNRYALTIACARADVSATLTLDAATGRIAGLILTGASARLPSLAAAVDALRALPGLTGLSVVRLDADTPVPLAALAADRPLAVGSAFKLLVLAELVRTVDAGERRWSDVIPLRIRAIPSGLLQDWPQDAPLTLHSLATLMIAQSDNSATDTLIALLGRDRVAAMAAPLGWPPHPGNDPLLTTLELAKLKGVAGGTPGERYAALSPAARRGLLSGEIARIPRDAIDQAALATRPDRIDTIEWFASPATLVRTLDWFRRQGDRPGGAGATALAILSVNPGLASADAGRFGYVGYKGGSEAGVLAMAYLFRTSRGRWYAAAAGWNDPNAVLAERRLIALMTRIAVLTEEADQR